MVWNLHLDAGLIGEGLDGLMQIGEIQQDRDKRLGLMDQAERLDRAAQVVSAFRKSDSGRTGYFGLDTAHRILQESVDATGDEQQSNFPFNISVFGWDRHSFARLAGTPPVGHLDELFQRPGAFLTQFMDGALDNVLYGFNMEYPSPALLADQAFLGELRNLSGPSMFYLLPHIHKGELLALSLIHRRYPKEAFLHPSDVFIGDSDQSVLQRMVGGKFTQWASDVAWILDAAGTYEVESKPFSPVRYLNDPVSEVVTFQGRTIEVIVNPLTTCGAKRQTILADLKTFAAGQFETDISGLVDEHFSGAVLTTVREGGKLLGYATGTRVTPPQELPNLKILYLSATVLDESLRGKSFQLIMNSIIADKTLIAPFWVAARTRIPRLYSMLKRYTEKLFPFIDGDMTKDADYDTALLIASALANQLKFSDRLDRFTAKGVYPGDIRLDTESGNGSKAFFERMGLGSSDACVLVGRVTAENLATVQRVLASAQEK